MSQLTVAQQAGALRNACDVAKKSPDRSTKNGAVLICTKPRHGVLSQVTDMVGFTICECNRYVYPQTAASDEAIQADRDTKLAYTEHAERMVLFQAAKWGYNTEGSVLVCPFAACADCARAIVAFGVAEVVRLPRGAFDGFPERWRKSINIADEMLKFSSVLVTEYAGPPLGRTYFLDGKSWQI